MYTNIVNIPDSILFLTSCRLAIKESVLINEDMEEYTKDGLVDFVMNEASDYQIMSIVVNDEYVEDKYDAIAEMELFDQYKEMVVENISEFSAVVQAEDLKSLLYEVGPISQAGISTAAPILEFLYESGQLNEKSAKDWAFDAEFKRRALMKKGKHKVKGAVKDIKGASQKVAGKASDVAGKAKQAASNTAFDAKFKARALAKKGKYKAGGAVKSAKQAATDLKNKAGGAISSAKQKASDAAFDARVKARGLKKSVPHKMRGAVATGKEKVAAAMGTKAGKAGAVALAAAAIYAGVKTYQRFMSQAARACGGQSGGAKTACMQKYKGNALKGQIAATQRGVSACAKAKDPAKCKASIAARVSKLQGKLQRVGA